MASQGVVVTPYVFSDYSQWERKQTCILNTTHSCVLSKHGQVSNKVISKPLGESDNNMRLLQIQIAHKRQSLEDTVERLQSLNQHNRRLITLIQSSDDETSGVVSGSLQRYHRFRGCISLIKDKSNKTLKEARTELRQFIEHTNRETQELENQIDKCVKLNKRQNKQLQTLMNYKDKDYPLKLVQTEQLRAQQEYLDEKHHKDEIDLESALEEENQKHTQAMEEIRMRMETLATEEYLSKMSCITVAKAVHNKIMEKEVLVHEKRLHNITRDIIILRDKIKVIKGLIIKNPAHQMRIQALGRCCPDVEILLNIS